MTHDLPRLPAHPAGEQPPIEQDAALAPATLDTWAGPVRVECDPTAPLTPYGQLPFFIEYLKVAGLFDALVADCPLAYRSPKAPEKRDVLGTTMFSVLAGHKRYAHITALRGTIPKSPDAPAMSTTLTRWPGCAWCSMSRLRREMSTHRSMRRQDCGRYWIAFRAIAGRHFCAAIAASVRKR